MARHRSSIRYLVILLTLTTSLILPSVAPAHAYAPSGDFVTVQGKQLIYNGQPIKLKGINFYPKDHPWADMWSQWNGPTTRDDLSRVSELGINTVRVLVPYSPQNGWTDKVTGKVDPVYVNELQQF